MEATQTEQTIRPLVQADQMLTEDDVKKLDRQARLKAELKKLTDHLKPRIAATIEVHGTGRLLVGNRQVELKETERATVSWKSISYAIAEEEAIEAVREVYTVTSTTRTAKVVN